MLPTFQIAISSYSLFSTIGLICAVIFVYFRIDKVGLSFKGYLLLLVIGTVFAFIGARLLFVIAILPQIDITFHNVLYYIINGGVVFYGGMIGLLFGISVFSKIRCFDCKTMLDMVAPAIPLFHFFARIGCLFAGCCYGIPWKWGVIMMDSPDIIRFPVQLCESICNLIILFIIIIRERKQNSFSGNITIYLILYAVCRFVLEYFRGDSVRGIWAFGLSTAQIISLIVFIAVFLSVVKSNVKQYIKEK